MVLNLLTIPKLKNTGLCTQNNHADAVGFVSFRNYTIGVLFALPLSEASMKINKNRLNVV